ncbi:MAG TPA: YbaB/EbfC family nucleoid-associated protein [Patescibacteria group bacterium]|nr:YbaB/EbfC family nucleoid-associated protein [Patescibacteria group bacterium]
MFNKLKQFKDLRSQAKTLQSQLAEESTTVDSTGGKISLTMDGNLKIRHLEIAEELLSPTQKERLTSGLISAHEEALKKMQRIMATKIKDMGGLPNIPGIN